MLYEISNPKVQLSKVTDVYALYQGVQHHDPDVELVLIDPNHAYDVQGRLDLLESRDIAVVHIKGVIMPARLKAIYVEMPEVMSDLGHGLTQDYKPLIDPDMYKVKSGELSDRGKPIPELPVLNVHLDKVPYHLKGGESAAIIDVTSQPDKGNDSE